MKKKEETSLYILFLFLTAGEGVGEDDSALSGESMAKGIYRVDGRFSGVSHQFKLINFVAFFSVLFFAPVVSVYVGPWDCPVLCCAV